MEQAILQLKAMSGRIYLNDWTGIWKLLRLVDETITPRAQWESIRRNFIKNYHLFMNIDEKGLFTCRDATDEDLDLLTSPEDVLLSYKRHGVWNDRWSEYELTHSAEDTLTMIAEELFSEREEHRRKCKEVAKRYGMEDMN